MSASAIRETSPPSAFIALYITRFRDNRIGEIEPKEFSMAVFLVTWKLSNVNIFVGINFDSVSCFNIITKVPLEDFPAFIDENSFSISLFIAEMTEIYFANRFNEPYLLIAVLAISPQVYLTLRQWEILGKEIAQWFFIFLENSNYGIQFIADLQAKGLVFHFWRF